VQKHSGPQPRLNLEPNRASGPRSRGAGGCSDEHNRFEGERHASNPVARVQHPVCASGTCARAQRVALQEHRPARILEFACWSASSPSGAVLRARSASSPAATMPVRCVLWSRRCCLTSKNGVEMVTECPRKPSLRSEAVNARVLARVRREIQEPIRPDGHVAQTPVLVVDHDFL
jgi:hypothetical protein